MTVYIGSFCCRYYAILMLILCDFTAVLCDFTQYYAIFCDFRSIVMINFFYWIIQVFVTNDLTFFECDAADAIN